MVAYYAKLTVMWDELSSYLKVSSCSCGGCTCGPVRESIWERDKEKLHKFCMGLDDAVIWYSSVPNAEHGHSSYNQQGLHVDHSRGTSQISHLRP